MCGIAGFLDAMGGHSEDELHERAVMMAAAVIHRGPDDSGIWVDAGAGIALAHRRLAIIDLSAAGHQPMTSASGRFVLVYNGELYNHRHLREELASAGHRFTGGSDTEVVLAAFEAWGTEGALRRMDGMFAIGLWDRERRVLVLARDRMGEKPLSYGWLDGRFVFASELRSILALPGRRPALDRAALAAYFRHNYVPAPSTAFEGIAKLLPGTYVEVLPAGGEVRPRPYWSLREVAVGGARARFAGTDREAADELDRRLLSAASSRMVSDVPVGAFLSGGIDSSMVVAAMQRTSAHPVRTFTVGFHEEGFDEAVHAEAVARHLGTEHTTVYLGAEDVLAAVPRIASVYDEPFGDSSQLPTLLISEVARRHVTVALSGDGGDELFGGYNRYVAHRTITRRLQAVPRLFRRAAAGGVRAVPAARWDSLVGSVGPLARRLPAQLVGDKLHKLAGVVATDSTRDAYRHLVSHWDEPERLVLGASEAATPLSTSADWNLLGDETEAMMLLDGLMYLPDDILVKVDRAAMAVSLETRVPLLAPEVVEFAWSLPVHMKIRNGEGKWLLRQVLHRYVPATLVERPKMGFGIPLGQWLRGPLRPWAEELLDRDRLAGEGLLDVDLVRQRWAEHQSGVRDWKYHFWDVLMLEAWLETLELHAG